MSRKPKQKEPMKSELRTAEDIEAYLYTMVERFSPELVAGVPDLLRRVFTAGERYGRECARAAKR